MAASANPSSSGNNNDGASAQKVPSSSSAETANGGTVNPSNNGGVSNGNSVAAADSSATQAALRHHTGISVEWTADEQSILDDLLIKFASESIVLKYAKIAMQLKDKTVRDVALRCRWMSKKENGKRRKEDHSARKNKDRKEKAGDSSAKSSSHLTRTNGPSYNPPMIPLDNDDGISFKDIGGVTGELLEQNAQILSQISANFASFQIHDNVNLLSKTRDNILTILNDLKDVPEIMKQMPPLPVKMNEELAKSILHPQSHQMK